ncbi:MAG: signal peptidase II [Butyricicoccaceae bacterium]
MLVILSILILVAIDQLVKYWAVTVLAPAVTMPVISGVFALTYVENTGAAFSLLAGKNQQLLLAAVALVIVCLAVLALKKGWALTMLGRISIYLIIAGAIGNLIDRVARGFVVDLFSFELIHFPVFNVADIYVVVGVILYLIYNFFFHEKAEAAKK